MTDLHAKISAALDREQAQAEAALAGGRWTLLDGFIPFAAQARYVAAQNPARTLRRVEADRRVLAQHVSGTLGDYCRICTVPCPCPDMLDLAARYDVGRTQFAWHAADKAHEIDSDDEDCRE